MKKLFCIICDRCRKICESPIKYEFVTKTGKILHFCSDECLKKHTSTKGLPPKPIPLKDGRCYILCLKCESWTKNSKHGQYKCYTHSCPAYIRDSKTK